MPAGRVATILTALVQRLVNASALAHVQIVARVKYLIESISLPPNLEKLLIQTAAPVGASLACWA